MIQKKLSVLARCLLPVLLLLPPLIGAGIAWAMYGELLRDLVNAVMKLGVLP